MLCRADDPQDVVRAVDVGDGQHTDRAAFGVFIRDRRDIVVIGRAGRHVGVVRLERTRDAEHLGV